MSAVDLRDHDGEVDMLEEKPVKVTSAPAVVSGWVDGVQATRPLTWVEQRGVALSWAAAGAAHTQGLGGEIESRLWIGCSAVDEEYANEIAHGAEVRPVPDDDPMTVATALFDQVAGERELLERLVVDRVAGAAPGLIVCDGPIVARTRHPRVCGVVKGHHTRYLDDHAALYRLPAGWRSPIFKISGRGGERFSCYVRLQNAERRWWDFGLLRLETFDPDIVDAFSAAVLAERQVQGSADGRWDRHLGTIKWVEEWLRARRPVLFN